MACAKLLLAMVLVAYHNGFGINALEYPEQCAGKSLCDIKPNNYDEIQDDMNKKFLPIKEKFNLKNEEYTSYNAAEYSQNNFNCRSHTRLIIPYLGKLDDGSMKAIVQTDYFKQKINITECLTENNIARDGDVCWKENVSKKEGQCRTKFSTIILFAFEKSEGIQRVTVNYPACCICHITNR